MDVNAGRASCASVAAAAVGLLLARPAATVEVDEETLKSRTAAAIADFRAAVALEPDLTRGAAQYEICAACHGADGRGASDGSVPAIAAQHVSVIVKQLVDFRHDRRWDQRMRHFASQHSLAGPQELLDVAAFAESLKRWPPLAGGPGDAAAEKLGGMLYHRHCARCHGPLGLGELRRMRPRLAGQHYSYLLRQLHETASGERPGMDAEHVRLAKGLSDQERSALADYLSRLSPHLASTENRAP